MQFRVALPDSSQRKIFQHAAADRVARKLDATQAVATRDFVLSERLDAKGTRSGMRINGQRIR